MENSVTLGEICHEYHPDERVCDWNFEDVHGERVYYKPSEKEGCGFSFYAIERVAYNTDEWDADSDVVECIVHGIAYFDGIRHLYFGDEKTENYGYSYYANVILISDILRVLSTLEDKYCSDL